MSSLNKLTVHIFQSIRLLSVLSALYNISYFLCILVSTRLNPIANVNRPKAAVATAKGLRRCAASGTL